MTTHYDVLFERAWEALNDKHSLKVICNYLDLAKYGADLGALHKSGASSLLLKIHGSVDRGDELMILSRRDYRHH